LSYAALVETVSTYLSNLQSGGPLRVAVDGRTACGKSTFAQALEASLQTIGCHALHTTIDGFHNPKAVRYARGRHSAEGYYRDARDLAAIRRELLDPLGSGGSRLIRMETFDLASDTSVDRPAVRVPDDTILIVDGTFLARPELSGSWDVHIFLRTRRETSRARGIARDIAAGGEPDQVKMIYDQRYLPAFDLYLSEADPEARSDILIDFEDFNAPATIRMTRPL
jgi:uridine kinase